MMTTIMNDTAVTGAGLTLVTQQQQQFVNNNNSQQQQQQHPLQNGPATGPGSAILHQQQQQSQQQQVPMNQCVAGAAAAGSVSVQQQQQHPINPPPPPPVVLSKQRLHELVQEIDPSEQLDEEVEDALLHMADDFIDQVVTAACQMARHRDSRQLEVRDVQLILEKEWNITIPGFGHNPLSQLNRFKSHSVTTEAHKQRMALIKKTLKKV